MSQQVESSALVAVTRIWKEVLGVDDVSRSDNFFSNYEPLTLDTAKQLLEDVIEFSQYTEPVQRLIRDFVEQGDANYLVATSHPRVIDGKPTKNPRYLQPRPDLTRSGRGASGRRGDTRPYRSAGSLPAGSA